MEQLNHPYQQSLVEKLALIYTLTDIFGLLYIGINYNKKIKFIHE